MQQKRPTSRAGKKTAFPAYTFNDFFALTALARKNSCCPKSLAKQANNSPQAN